MDWFKLRKEFPQLQSETVYLDNGATTLKPKCVLEKMDEYYTQYGANIHRGNYAISEKATEEYEKTRLKVRDFIGARSEKEVIFTKGTTESINLVAFSYCSLLSPGDEILITQMEHHSNIVPWQLMAERYGLVLKYVKLTKEGEWDLEDLDQKITSKTKLFSCNHVSNSLGTVNPIKMAFEKVKKVGAVIFIDAAQSIAHFKWDVQELPVDFLAFSGHKMYGPTGVGVLYGKQELLEKMPPYQSGGDMIEQVKMDKTTFAELPHKFEAGTPPIASIIGLGSSIDFLNNLDLQEVRNREIELLDYAESKLKTIPGLTVYGTAKNKSCALSFLIKSIHPLDLGTYLDSKNLALRSGHHCTGPVMDFFEIPGTIRASFSFYNTKEEIDYLYNTLIKAMAFFNMEES